MNKDAKKILSRMDEKKKLQMLNGLLEVLETPHIVLIDLGNDTCGVCCSETIGRQKFLSMISWLMVGLAKQNNETAIKLLADLGETISEIMNHEESKRAKSDNKGGDEASK